MTMRTLAAALLLAACAAPAAAQDLRPIRAADTVGVAAASLYELVERLRPEWLSAGGDPADFSARERVRVIRSGMAAGGLDALRGMPVDGLVQVRLAGRRTAIARDPHTPPDVAAALLVTYATHERGRRVELVVGFGRRGTEMEDRARESLARGGWDGTLGEMLGWPHPHRSPATRMAAAAVALRPGAGVMVTAHRTPPFNVRGISPVSNPPLPPLAQTTWIGTTDVAATVFAQRHVLRGALGPALRVADYRRTTGYCECRDTETGHVTVLGAAGDVAIVFPPVGPAVMQLQASVRWFPPHAVPAGGGMPQIDLGGTSTYFTIAAGFGI